MNDEKIWKSWNSSVAKIEDFVERLRLINGKLFVHILESIPLCSYLSFQSNICKINKTQNVLQITSLGFKH
jgi:hypothetical protein